MGLRFPLPRFIAELCQHIKISPSQLAPKSYSFLLSLAILLRYHNLPLVPYVLMQLIKIKRLGPGKFYLSHKGDHAFIKGNPSSHKGWMSRFFFVKRVDRKRDPWKCDMSWRDNIFTLTPRTPERSPNLTSFLDAMREKSYNAPELIKEDLLCVFGFSKRGVELVGDLDERMGKAKLLKAMQEEARALGEVAPPKKATKKRSASYSAEKEASREKRKKKGASTSGTQTEETPKMTREPMPPKRASEEIPDLPPVITISEASSRGSWPPGTYETWPPIGISKCWRGPKTSCLWVTSWLTLPRYAMAWGGEVMKFLTRAHQTVKATRRNFDEAMGQHAEVVERLEEFEVLRAREEGAAKAQREALESELAAEKEALGAELKEVKGWAEQEAERLKSEAREEFLKSPEFDALLANNAWGYFKDGFWGCLAQFRTNGYSEEEHLDSFLDVQFVSRARAGFPYSVEVSSRWGVDAYMSLSVVLVGLMRVVVEELCESGQCGTGIRCSSGVATRGGASAGLGLVVELVGLTCLRRRAMRVASAELGLSAP
ncbi:hypothetical protein F511_39048 [Dorcoceras hygrometricum]|uniref:Uncharacterized protein n=1 Tax=Dorcoceras hygrometricum TaxID=472368 RepID=A0A2Z7B716_9LAMI|nr:hypothetical protein F511_39048 [Dorcoceras hygrometricum]